MPKNEHELKETLIEDVFYPDHEPRTESETFRRTKAAGKKAGHRCAISGRIDKLEYHHIFAEWAYSSAIDWETVKGIALGTVKELPVLDLITDAPTGEMYAVEHSLIYIITQLAKVRGFDWQAFDPAKPETFVDSMENMLVLHEKFHRAKQHGIHSQSFPIWLFQAFPRKAGFVFCADEIIQGVNHA